MLLFVILNNGGIKIKCRRECKELIGKGVCDIEFIWNPSNCECECDKTCDIGEYLDYEHCKWRKKIIDKLVDECTETIEGVKLARITLAENENSHKCSSCAMYTVLFWIFFTIDVGGIVAYFIYFRGYLRNMFTRETTYKWEKSNKLTLKIKLIIFAMIELI